MAILKNSITSAHAAQAEPIFRQTLALRIKVIGVKNWPSLDSIFNLAITFYQQGKYNKLEQIHQNTLVLRKEIFGMETFDSTSYLALITSNLALITSSLALILHYKEA